MTAKIEPWMMQASNDIEDAYAIAIEKETYVTEPAALDIAAIISEHFPAEAAVPVSELMQALIEVANETASPMGTDTLSLAGKRLTMLENAIHKLIHRYQTAGAEHD